MNVYNKYYREEVSSGLNLNFCGYEACRSSHAFGPVKRAHYLLHYVIKGKGSYSVNKKTYSIGEGEGFIIFPGEITYYVADHEDPWEYIWIGFDGTECDSILNQCGLRRIQHKFMATNKVATTEAFMTIINYSKKEEAIIYRQQSNLYALFATMVRPKRQPSMSDKNYIAQGINFIEKNYYYNIKVTDIAHSIGLERSYLYRIFKKETNQSPRDYLINYRLKMAKALLKEKELTITEVALSSGFKSSSAFYKHFKNYFNLTPKEYQKGLI